MPDSSSFLLGIDVGSTTTRCLLFGLDGIARSEAHREPTVHHPETSWSEVEPEDWWRATVAVIRDVLEDTGIAPERIRAIGLTGLQHALVPLDREGRALARSMLWMDQRCQPQVDWMLGEHRALLEEVKGDGVRVSTTQSAPKLRWLVEHDPEVVERTAVFLPVKDFIRYRLTGTIATDDSDARSTFLVDQSEQ